MHKIQEKEFTLDDFSTDKIIDTGEPGYENMYNGLALTLHYDGEKQYYDPHDIFSEILIPALNLYRKRYLETKDKRYWWQMIQLLPSSYNQTRNVMMNYEVLANIYKSRKDHKLDEWREFCKWIETLPYSELITGAAGSLEARRMFSEPFPWTKEAGERLKSEMEGIIKTTIDKELHNAIIPDNNQSSFSAKDLEEAMKHYDLNDGVKTHVTMMKED